MHEIRILNGEICLCESDKLGAEHVGPLKFLNLTLKKAQVRCQFSAKRIDLRDIFFGLLKLPRRFLLLEFVEFQSERVLQYCSAIPR